MTRVFGFYVFGTLLYHFNNKVKIRNFGIMLEPRYIFGAETLDQ